MRHKLLIIRSVAIKGMTAPRVTLDTAIKLRDFNLEMNPLRKSWRALANTSDGLVFLTSQSLSPDCKP